MQCSQCQHENSTAARFCEQCGSPLARVCGNCGHDARAGAKYCEACGRELAASGSSSPPLPDPRSYTPKHLIEKILSSGSALKGERKLVTVLFADVKGSMELAERLDPEEWHQIINRFFAILSEGIHRFEGTVNQYTGDGIMALFGAPIAHEDHAQRACYAALHLNDELRRYAQELKRERELTLSVRMGLNSGEVVVGAIGDNLRMDYTALVHTVGLAQRMEHLADPGTVYLTEHTAALVSGFFRLRDLGQFELKGTRPCAFTNWRALGHSGRDWTCPKQEGFHDLSDGAEKWKLWRRCWHTRPRVTPPLLVSLVKPGSGKVGCVTSSSSAAAPAASPCTRPTAWLTGRQFPCNRCWSSYAGTSGLRITTPNVSRATRSPGDYYKSTIRFAHAPDPLRFPWRSGS